jgi:hypothetical protein
MAFGSWAKMLITSGVGSVQSIASPVRMVGCLGPASFRADAIPDLGP